MNKHEKLVLIQECCEHADEYRPFNKTKFWAMISDLLKQQTGYHLGSPQQTVAHWVKAQMDELIEEQMGSGTEVERHDFKTAVEQFADRMNTVAQEINDAFKYRQLKAAENLAAARLENSLVFQIDDEPIAGVDLPQNSKGFKEATASLANTYRARNLEPAPIPNVNGLEQRIGSVEDALREVKVTLGNMENKIERVLQALTRLNAAAGLGPPTGGESTGKDVPEAAADQGPPTG